MRLIKLRRMRRAGHVARMGENNVVHSVLVVKSEGRRPFGITRLRWVDNIRVDLQNVGSWYMDWFGLARDKESCQRL